MPGSTRGRPVRSVLVRRSAAPPWRAALRAAPRQRSRPAVRWRKFAFTWAVSPRTSAAYCPVPFRPEVLQGSDLRCLKSDGEHRYRDLPVSPRHTVPPGAAIHDRRRRSGAGVPQLRGKDPPHAPIALGVPQHPWHRTRTYDLCALSRFFLNDLDHPFCHPLVVISGCLTPMHHLMLMVSSVASGSRR